MEFGNNLLDNLINHWKFSSVITYGSGRPINATMAGDPNQDDNTYNDRLPGYPARCLCRPRTTSPPTFASAGAYVLASSAVGCHGGIVQPVQPYQRAGHISDDGFYNSAGQFVAYSTSTLGNQYPGYFQLNSNFLLPTSAYAPRQVQLVAAV